MTSKSSENISYDEAIEARLKAFVRLMASTPELPMRRALLADLLRDESSRDGANILNRLAWGTISKTPPFVDSWEAMLDPYPLIKLVGEDKIHALADEAEMAELRLARIWLRGVHTFGKRTARSFGRESKQLIDKDLRDLTLGHRRSGARNAKHDEIARFIGDPDPGVIFNLLSNPRLTQSQAIAICARRPTVSDVLETVLNHYRWQRIYEIRLALVRNPFLALIFGVNLLPLLKKADLQDVSEDGVLDSGLRDVARLMLKPPS